MLTPCTAILLSPRGIHLHLLIPAPGPTFHRPNSVAPSGRARKPVAKMNYASMIEEKNLKVRTRCPSCYRFSCAVRTDDVSATT